MPTNAVAGALDGVRVLNCTDTLAGGWCGRLLADLGADVVLVEPAGGSTLRSLAPFDAEGRSIPARYVYANQRSVVLDSGEIADSEAWRALFATADIVLVRGADDPHHALGMAAAEFEAAHPSMVRVAVSPLGFEGGQGNDLTTFALSGWAAVNGPPGRSPLKGPGFVASYAAGAVAAQAAIAGLLHSERTGVGQSIAVAERDVLSVMFAPIAMHALYTGQPTGRHVMWWSDPLGGPAPVKDGYFVLMISRAAFWRDSMNALGLTDLAEDQRYQSSSFLNQHAVEFRQRVFEKLAEREKMELFEHLSTLRVLAAPVLDVSEVAENEHLQARGYFVRPAGSPNAPRIAGPPFRLSATPPAVRLLAPTIGEHTDEALASPVPRADRHSTAQSPPPEDSARPLDGVRVLALTQIRAGAACAQTLALLGAEVIKVEARRKPDVWRGAGGYDFAIPAALQDVPTAQHGWNCHPSFNSSNLGMEGITLDLQTSEGIEVFRRLVAQCDVVVENYAPRVLMNLSMPYEAMRELKPDVILCSISAYGQDGPYCHRPANGATIEPASGVSSLLGYPDGPPMNSGAVFPDPMTSHHAVVAILAALRHRARTGEGQRIDVSMQEVNVAVIGDAVLEYELTGRVRPRMGNRHPGIAPHSIYPAAGEDRWLAIAAEDERQWATFCDLTGHPEWRTDPRFATNAARKQHEDDLDAAIAAWSAMHDRDDLARRLAKAGVAAAPVLEPGELSDDAGMCGRGVIVDVTHPEAGRWPHIAVPWQFSRTPARATRPAPRHGEHSFEVFAHLLGMTAEEYDALVAKGVTGMGPPD